MNKQRVAELIRELLIEIGENPDREGLVKTPMRVAEAYTYLTSGYNKDFKSIINDAIFQSDANNMIISRNIEVFSLCEHHILPFYGVCHIGYIAEGRVLGVSKLARIVDYYARRLQIQERLTDEIAHAVKDAIGAEGVGVVMEARHMCMMMRGVEKLNSTMITSSVLGSFHDDLATREEFMSLINHKSSFNL